MKFSGCILLLVIMSTPLFSQESVDTTVANSPQEIITVVRNLLEEVDSSQALQTTLRIKISLESLEDSTTVEELVITKGVKGPFLVVKATERKKELSIEYQKARGQATDGVVIKKPLTTKTAKDNIRLKGEY